MIQQLIALALISLMAHLEKNSVFWLIAAGMSIFIGFYWYDAFVNNLGLAMGIGFLIYGLNCFAIAFRQLFTQVRDLLARSND